MVGHGGSSAGSSLANPTSPIPSHCASIVVTSTLRVNRNYCGISIPLITLYWLYLWGGRHLGDFTLYLDNTQVMHDNIYNRTVWKRHFTTTKHFLDIILYVFSSSIYTWYTNAKYQSMSLYLEQTKKKPKNYQHHPSDLESHSIMLCST